MGKKVLGNIFKFGRDNSLDSVVNFAACLAQNG
jgi:hypothetical protein